MIYSSQSLGFLQDKNHFFSISSQGTLQEKIDCIDNSKSSKSHDYAFLLRNQKIIEDEFIHMFAVLQKKKSNNEDAFWLYCYYCATLLESFYRAYDQESNAASFKKKKEDIKERLLGTKKVPVSQEQFIESLKNSFIGSVRHVMDTPRHISQIRDYAVYANLLRGYWFFCRSTLTTGLTLAKNLQILDKLDSILGTHTDVDKIISVMQAPSGVLSYFSVGLFLFRFMIDGGMLLKHTFFPTDEAKKNTTVRDRFNYEFNKRHWNFTNDLVWATANFLANFTRITGLSNPAVGVVIAVTLCFDLSMAFYGCYLAKKEYLIKKAQYEKELEELSKSNQHDVQKSVRLEMVHKQLRELEIKWCTKQGFFYFAAAGASFILIGFSAAFLLSPPGIILAGFFMGILGMAIYLSLGAFSTYKEKSLRLEQAKLTGNNLDEARKEYKEASNDFMFTMVKNALVPTFLIAAYAVCWPAALALTVVYVGYELVHAYLQHRSKNSPWSSPSLRATVLEAQSKDLKIKQESLYSSESFSEVGTSCS